MKKIRLEEYKNGLEYYNESYGIYNKSERLGYRFNKQTRQFVSLHLLGLITEYDLFMDIQDIRSKYKGRI